MPPMLVWPDSGGGAESAGVSGGTESGGGDEATVHYPSDIPGAEAGAGPKFRELRELRGIGIAAEADLARLGITTIEQVHFKD